jgi:hypothetical protein
MANPIFDPTQDLLKEVKEMTNNLGKVEALLNAQCSKHEHSSELERVQVENGGNDTEDNAGTSTCIVTDGGTSIEAKDSRRSRDSLPIVGIETEQAVVSAVTKDVHPETKAPERRTSEAGETISELSRENDLDVSERTNHQHFIPIDELLRLRFSEYFL